MPGKKWGGRLISSNNESVGETLAVHQATSPVKALFNFHKKTFYPVPSNVWIHAWNIDIDKKNI
jgi:hypothetical protein